MLRQLRQSFSHCVMYFMSKHFYLVLFMSIAGPWQATPGRALLLDQLDTAVLGAAVLASIVSDWGQIADSGGP